MPTSFYHAATIPFSGWWLIVIGILLILILYALRKKRKIFLLFLSASSIVLATLIGAAMLLPSAVACEVDVGWKGPMAPGGTWISIANMMVINGGLSFSWSSYAGPNWEYTRNFTLSLAAIRDTNLNYPLPPERLSIIKSNFIRKTLGFDAVWWDGIDPSTKNDVHSHALIVPLWFAFLLCIPFPALTVRRYLKKRKIRRWIATGCCSQCGWDLRGTPPAAGGIRRCAECGTVNAPPPAQPAPSPLPPAVT